MKWMHPFAALPVGLPVQAHLCCLAPGWQPPWLLQVPCTSMCVQHLAASNITAQLQKASVPPCAWLAAGLAAAGALRKHVHAMSRFSQMHSLPLSSKHGCMHAKRH